MPDTPWFGLLSGDADASADLAIFGVPYDRSVYFRRGAASAPRRLREISAHLPPVTEDGEIIRSMRVADLGDVEVDPGASADDDLRERIAAHFLQARALGLPLALGGDHSISIPLLSAAAEWVGRDMGILWIDAHPDLCDVFHGSTYSHACVLRRALDHPSIHPRNVAMLGTRSYELEEVDFIRANPMTVLTAQHLAHEEAERVGAALVDRFTDMPVYLSLDIDAFDPGFAPGTGIPDAGGLTSRWVIDLLHALGPLNVIAMDLVEIAPPLDAPSDPTSLLGLKVILEMLGTIAAREGR